MEDYFESIKGYEDIKKELYMYVDAINRQQEYRDLGIRPEKGLIITGRQGTGKTMMANAMIKALGRELFVCRKTRSGGEFVDEIADVFCEAADHQPAVVLLEDIDRFSNHEDPEDAEEYAVIESWMNEIQEKDADIYVIATARSLRRIPDSLLGVGRFAEGIATRMPREDEIEEIITHCLSKIGIDADVDQVALTKILSGYSGDLPGIIIDGAAKRVFFERREKIEMKDIIDTYLDWKLGARPLEAGVVNEESKRLAYHEAGHVLVSELLNPGSVSIASILKEKNQMTGAVEYDRPIEKSNTYDGIEANLKTSLAGKAAVEIVMGTADDGVDDDMKNAIGYATALIDDLCALGFQNMIEGDHDETVLENKNRRIETVLDTSYLATKRLIAKNRVVLDKLASELLDKSVLTYTDIQNVLKTNSMQSIDGR